MLNSNQLRKIIVNADDFGMSAEVNRAIIEAFKEKAISSATLMANMPGFEEACDLAHQYELRGRIGVHLNLTAGYPLSDSIRGCPRFCHGSGMFRNRRTRFWLSRAERLAVIAEFSAQIKACLDHGVRPTHLDSHHHIHTEWAIGAAAITVARQYGIKAIRLSRNCGPGIDFVRKLYKGAYNFRLRIYGLAKTRYFGSSADTERIPAISSGAIEVMVHLGSETSADTLDSAGDLGPGRWFATQQLANYP